MKALMIATKPEWTCKIINEEKDLEFRNYAIPKGTRVLVYESLGKSMIVRRMFNSKTYREKAHEGRGKVVLEFTVGECYETRKVNYIDLSGESYRRLHFKRTDITQSHENTYKENAFDDIGYTNQKYAHTITDLIVYDEEWIIELADKVELSNDYFDKLVKAHIAPQPITNYVGWKKWQIIKDDKELYLSENPHLTRPPQGRVWIYLEEER